MAPRSKMNPPANLCPTCGSPVPDRASEGLCPRCLIAGVLAQEEQKGEPATEGDTTLTSTRFPRPFGDYELLDRIASGGMGVVYRARHVKVNRVVALKMLREGRLASPEAVRRFLLEAEAAGRLDHPNIVPIYEVGSLNGRHFFTMRCVEGGSLAEKVPGDGAALRPPRMSARVMAKVARAVHFAHERGILHRDLKPANILLDPGGEPLVTDFGLAKLMEPGAGGDLTLSGTVVGTPAYMAPEQATGTLEQQTTAADIYSLGAILYFLLAGQPPLEGATPLETMRRLVETEAPPPGSLNPQVDRDLDTICLKCLEKDPSRRYASAAALADDLERWLRHEPIEARQTPSWEKVLKWCRRRPALTALLIVTALAAVAFVAQKLDSESRLRDERDRVVLSERRAQAAARSAEQHELNTRLHLYAADIALAGRALEDGNLGLSRRVLAAHLPASGEPDLRGFEWRHLWAKSRGDAAVVLQAHAKGAGSVAFSRDGTLLATGGRDGRVRFWNVSNGAPGLVLPPADVPPRAHDPASIAAIVAESPEVASILAAGIESSDGISMRIRPTTLGDVRKVALSADGTWLATGSDGSYVRVWDIPQRAIRFVIPITNPRALAFTPDGRHLVVGENTGRGDNMIKVYDLATHRPFRTLKNVTGHFALAPDGSSLAVVAHSRTLMLHSLRTGGILRQWVADEAIHELAWSPDGKMLAGIGNSRREVHLWSAETGGSLGRFSASSEGVLEIAFSPDSKLLAMVGLDHAVRLRDLQQNRESRVWRGHGEEVLGVAFAPDGRCVASASKDATVRLWPMHASHGEDRWELTHEAAAVGDDGQTLATRSDGGHVRVCDMAMRQITLLPGDERRFVLGFDNGGKTLFTLERKDDTAAPVVRSWNRAGQPAGEPVPVREAPDGRLAGITGAPAAGCGALAVSPGRVIVFQLHSGLPVQRLTWAKREASRLLLSGDAQLLAAVSWPGHVRLWRIPPGSNAVVVADWKASESPVQRLAFSPDGHMLATAGEDNIISLWDTATAAAITTLRGHKAEVSALAFTPDGRTLASASKDLTLKLWHVPTWRELGTLERGQFFTFLAFAGKEPVLFASEYRKCLHLLRAPQDGPVIGQIVEP